MPLLLSYDYERNRPERWVPLMLVLLCHLSQGPFLATRIFNRRAVHFEQAVYLQARARHVRGRGSPITGQAYRARSLV